MSSLKSHEKAVFEKIFNRGGFVLDFNDRTYAEFFREHGISINAEKYCFNGTSKMKRLRAFWEIESDALVGAVLEALLKYAKAVGVVNENDSQRALEISSRLLSGAVDVKKEENEKAFLQMNFERIDLHKIDVDSSLQKVIEQRLTEIGRSLKADAPLAVIFLCGSTLEGLLLDAASKNAARFNSSGSAPKSKEGKVKQLHEWTLESLINVSHELDLLSLDVKKYSHTLRDFRNYIHPREQACQHFNPDLHTAKISWQVLLAAISDLSGNREK